ncbi:MAG: hypothetical protein P8P29_08470 [Flavobacteriaceae bacterium]|nr:hypothetical protein [Flavobacteriaceae bacterium]
MTTSNTNYKMFSVKDRNKKLAALINEIEVINIKRNEASRLAKDFKNMDSEEKYQSIHTRNTLKERYDDIVIELHDKYGIKLPLYDFIIKMREVA